MHDTLLLSTCAPGSLANNPLLVQLNGIVSVSMALFMVYICSRLLVADTSQLFVDANVISTKKS